MREIKVIKVSAETGKKIEKMLETKRANAAKLKKDFKDGKFSKYFN